MNVRYLYRAKRTDNGEWVEGFYCKRKTGHYDNIGFHEEYKDCIIVEFSDVGITWCDVDPSTICQCTGLKDKNENLIWENDILVGYLDDEFPDDATYIKVLWYERGFYCKENDSSEYIPLEEFHHKYFKVCGNIFDNPELLEVGE